MSFLVNPHHHPPPSSSSPLSLPASSTSFTTPTAPHSPSPPSKSPNSTSPPHPPTTPPVSLPNSTSPSPLQIPTKKKLHFHDPFTITLQSHETQLANGSLPNYLTIKPNNITIIHSQLYTTSLLLDPETVTKIRSDLKKKSRLSLKLLLDTEFRVNIETLRTKKVGIQIECDGIHSLIPKGGGIGWNTTMAATLTATKWTL
ncbi:hypothetical protein Hdeb2414_s0182g00825781 [Helianthus debilis subsp. tardiflorus]